MPVGDAARILLTSQRLSPELVDAFLVSAGFDAQRTSEPKTENDLNSFDEAIPDFNRVEGDFSNQSLSVSVSDWLDTHPLAKWGALAGTLGLVFLAGQAFKIMD